MSPEAEGGRLFLLEKLIYMARRQECECFWLKLLQTVTHRSPVFLRGGGHFNETVMLLSFAHSAAISSPGPQPSSLTRTQDCINTRYITSELPGAEKTWAFLRERIKNPLPLCPNLLWGDRGLLCCCGSWDPELYSNLPLPPINFAGFLAAASGQVRTMQLYKKKKKKVSFFPAAYLLRWHGSRNHKSWNIIKTNLQSRFVRLS